MTQEQNYLSRIFVLLYAENPLNNPDIRFISLTISVVDKITSIEFNGH